MSPSTVHSHLPDYIHAEVIEDSWRGDIAQSPHTKTTVGSLATCVDLSILGYDKESL